MKAFKKLMAAALVCVMALTVLTGCGVADKKTEKHMVEALNNAAKAAKVEYTYERTDAMDSIAKSALSTAQKSKKIEDAASVGTNYVVYTTELKETWNSTSDLKTAAEAAHKAFVDGKAKVDAKKVSVGVETGKVGDKNYVIVVAKKATK